MLLLKHLLQQEKAERREGDEEGGEGEENKEEGANGHNEQNNVSENVRYLLDMMIWYEI